MQVGSADQNVRGAAAEWALLTTRSAHAAAPAHRRSCFHACTRVQAIWAEAFKQTDLDEFGAASIAVFNLNPAHS